MTPAIVSRRERREATQGTRRRAEPTPRERAKVDPTPSKHRWVPRAAVLGTLAIATIAMPLSAVAEEGTDTASPFEPEGVPGPGTLEVLSAQPTVAPISATVAASANASTRDVASSRSSERGPLPGCDADVRPTGTNGNLDPHGLCDLWQAGESLRPDAAVSLSAMNEAFSARFGREMCLVSSYRTYSSQVGLQTTRAGFATAAGKSMHGWGLAIDLCSKETGSSEVYSWITANAGTYGWENPKWAKRGGGRYEPWHFEYVKGVEEIGGY